MTMAFSEIDISSEEYRTYHYPDGSMLKVENPTTLYLHRDEEGWTHRILYSEFNLVMRPERGWIGISWKPRKGAPVFVK